MRLAILGQTGRGSQTLARADGMTLLGLENFGEVMIGRGTTVRHVIL
jgi:hypothetical protein